MPWNHTDLRAFNNRMWAKLYDNENMLTCGVTVPDTTDDVAEDIIVAGQHLTTNERYQASLSKATSGAISQLLC